MSEKKRSRPLDFNDGEEKPAKRPARRKSEHISFDAPHSSTARVRRSEKSSAPRPVAQRKVRSLSVDTGLRQKFAAEQKTIGLSPASFGLKITSFFITAASQSTISTPGPVEPESSHSHISQSPSSSSRATSETPATAKSPHDSAQSPENCDTSQFAEHLALQTELVKAAYFCPRFEEDHQEYEFKSFTSIEMPVPEYIPQSPSIQYYDPKFGYKVRNRFRFSEIRYEIRRSLYGDEIAQSYPPEMTPDELQQDWQHLVPFEDEDLINSPHADPPNPTGINPRVWRV